MTWPALAADSRLGSGVYFYDSIKFALLLIGIIFLVTNNLGGGSQAGRQPP